MYPFLRKLLFLILFFLLASPLFADEFYWIGGKGNWSDINHWATTSGGAVLHGATPGVDDNVYFDSNSFTAANQSVTINVENSTCKNFDCTGARANTSIVGTYTLQVYGSMVLTKNMKFNFTGWLKFEGSDGNYSLTTAGNTINCTISTLGQNAKFLFKDQVKSTGSVYFDGNSSEYNCQSKFTTGSFYFRGDNAHLTFQDSLITTAILDIGASLSANSGVFEAKKYMDISGTFTMEASATGLEVYIDCPAVFNLDLNIDGGSYFSSDYPCSIYLFQSLTDKKRTIVFNNKYLILEHNWRINSKNLSLDVSKTTIDFRGVNLYDPPIRLVEAGRAHKYHKMIFEKSSGGPFLVSQYNSIDSIESLSPTTLLNDSSTIGYAHFVETTNFNGNYTFGTLSLNRGKQYVFASTMTQEITTDLIANGDCTGSIVFRTDKDEATSTIKKTTGTLNLSYIISKDIIALASSPFQFEHSADLGGNKNIVFVQSAGTSLYWVGGTGRWDEVSHWSFTSGGPGGACVPSPYDDVFFDANSFDGPDQAVEIASDNIFSHDMIWENVKNTPRFFSTVSGRMNVYGSLRLASYMEMTYNVGSTLVFEAHDLNHTVTMNSHKIDQEVRFNGTGGGWTLMGDLGCTKNIYLNNGNLNTNSKIVGCDKFISTHMISSRSLTLGSSVVYVKKDWTLVNSDLTFDAGTSNIHMTWNEKPLMNSGIGLNYYNVYFDDPGAIGTINGNQVFFNTVDYKCNAKFEGIQCTANKLIFETTGEIVKEDNHFVYAFFEKNATVSKNTVFDTLKLKNEYVYLIKPSVIVDINNLLDANGSCSSFVTIKSASNGQAAHIRKTSGTVDIDYVMLKDIDAEGGAVFTANNVVDMGNNTGWNMQRVSGRNLYWVGGAGVWSDPSHWSLTSGGTGPQCIPTPLDNVYFDSNSALSDKDIQVDLGNIYCKNMNWSASIAKAYFRTMKATNINIFGSLKSNPNIQYAATTSDYTNFVSDGAETIDTQSQLLGSNVTFDGAGSWTLASDFAVANITNLNQGTLNTNNKTLKTGGFKSSSDRSPVLNASKSTIYLNGDWLSENTFDMRSDSVSIIFTYKGKFENYANKNIALNDITFQQGGDIITNTNGTGTTSFRNARFTGPITASVTGKDTYFKSLYCANRTTITGPVSIDSLLTIKKCEVFGANTIRSLTSYDLLILYAANKITKATLYGDAELIGNNVYDTLTLTPNRLYKLGCGNTQKIVKQLNAAGNRCFRIKIQSNCSFDVGYIEKDGDPVEGYALDLADIYTKGKAKFFAGGPSTDNGNCIGWNFVNRPGYIYGLPRDSIFPQGSTAVITTNHFNGTNTTQYIWQDGSTGPVFSTQTPVRLIVKANYSPDANTAPCYLQDTMNIFFAEIKDVNCTGYNTGAIKLYTDPTINYSLRWSTGSTDKEITNIAAANYDLTINEVVAKKVMHFTVKVNKLTTFEVAVQTFSPSCSGLKTGKIKSIISGGTPPFSLIWNGDPNLKADSLTDLVGNAVYTLDALENSGCPSYKQLITLTEPDPLSINFITSDISCFGKIDGALKGKPLGGTAPYSFRWREPINTSSDTLLMLPKGIFTLEVTDKNNCQVSQSTEIIEPQLLSAQMASQFAPTCFDASNGMAVVKANMGTPPYQFNWRDFPNNHTDTLKAILGNRYYQYQLKDSRNCLYVDSVKINAPTAIAIETSSLSPLLCNGASDASLFVKATGGMAGYTYQLEDLRNTVGLFENLSSGNYKLSVTDANSCTYTAKESIFIQEPAAITYSVKTRRTTRDSINGGAIYVSINNPSDYQISITDQSNQVVSDPLHLTQGTYHIKVTNKLGCTATSNAEVVYYEYDSNITAPNVFTPNGDQVNDEFSVTYKDIDWFHCVIFNRWGQLMYEWDGVENSWDGKTRGAQASEGVYYYVITAMGRDKKHYNLKGYLELIR